MNDFGDIVFDMETRILSSLADGSVRWRETAEMLSTLKPLYIAELGLAEFTKWRRNLGISDSAASKMLTVAEFVPYDRLDLSIIGGTKLYDFARAVRDGADFEDAAVDAQVLSSTDFRARWGPETRSKTSERRGQCPQCGLSDALDVFVQRKRTVRKPRVL